MVTVDHFTDPDLAAFRSVVTRAGLPLDGLGAVPTDVFVASVGGHVVGVAAIERHGTHGLVRSVAVDPGHQGRGIGTALLDSLERHALETGIEGLYLLTETAEAFFAGRGYLPIGRDAGPVSVMASVEWSSACPDSAVAMARR